MSGKKNNEKYTRTSWHNNGAREEAFVFEKQFGGEGEGSIHGNFQSRGMKGYYPKDHKNEDLKDFQLQDSVTGNERSCRRNSRRKSPRGDKGHETQKYKKTFAEKEHQYVLPLKYSENGMHEYSGVIEDLNSGKKTYTSGFTTGPSWSISGNDPKEMKEFATMLKDVSSDSSSDSDDSCEASEN
ncbi:Hypothetical predicted protein, partial [Mytilus galloprovincialis]